MKKSVSIAILEIYTNTNEDIVYRVSWLRARARAQRWREEKEIVMKEMEWVMGSFSYMEEVWKARSSEMGDEKPGHRAYARREADRWKGWKEIAKKEFMKVTGAKNFTMQAEV
jgi:hypothetical protein